MSCTVPLPVEEIVTKDSPMTTRLLCVGLLAVSVCTRLHATDQLVASPQSSVLICNGRDWPAQFVDYRYLRELHEHGSQIEATEGQPLTWDRISKFHCLVLYNLPADLGKTIPGTMPGPPFRPEFRALLDRYLKAGGGVLIDVSVSQRTEAIEDLFASYLVPWGAKLPMERAVDPANQAPHPRLQNQPFLAADALPSPVSEGVRNVWFPCGTGGYNWEQYGGLIEVDHHWTKVLRGSATCTTEPLRPTMALGPTERYSKPQYVRRGVTRPTLFAIRELPGGGRLALMNAWNVFHLGGGTTWVHDRAMLDRGLGGRTSDFGRLLENTFRWLAAPALKNGTLGGYRQDSEKLRMPTERLQARQMFPAAEWQQNPTPPRRAYRGLIGARSAASGGRGAVVEYAAAAKQAGLDFVVFLEDFAQLTEPAYRKLEAECRTASNDQVLLLPGFRIDTNLGTHYFAYGRDIPWLEGPQLSGPNRRVLRLQQFDGKGLLVEDDQAVHNWQFAVMDFVSRNLGYYDCRANQHGTPIYNLRMFGMQAVMTYRHGKLVEDITPEYLDYVADTIPPRACAVDLVDAPEELQQAVRAGHYLTHVAVESLAKVPEAMCHGHQYGRPNVYPSQGPEIRAWAGTQRITTYAGEPFVPARYRVRPECLVSSEAGLKEIVLWCDGKQFRRFLPGGAKEFHRTFEWAFDRHREIVLEAVDLAGRRAVSASRSIWCDANANWWCNDRQNSMIGTCPNNIPGVWHGPAMLPEPQVPWFDCGPTWDGGPTAYIGLRVTTHPALQSSVTTDEGFWMGVGGRTMEGNCTPTLFDDSVSNLRITCDRIYAPGIVANAYNTIGPGEPSKGMDWSMRRTGFVERVVGVGPMHPMWPARAGGTVTSYDTTITFKQDQKVQRLLLHSLETRGFSPGNRPRWIVCEGPGQAVVGDPVEKQGTGMDRVAPGKSSFRIHPGGYVACVGTGESNTGMVFNIGREPLVANASPWGWFLEAELKAPAVKAGQKLETHVIVVLDALDQTDRSPERIEKVRRYFGLAGEKENGLVVRRGKVLSHRGPLAIAPDHGLVELDVPNPGWKFDLPFGVRFEGFNPNWSVLEIQHEGYLPPFYKRPGIVCRSLGLDDQRQAFLSLYPDHARRARITVGHPVQCSAPDLVIEVAMLFDSPPQYHVAVNNPTDRPIRSVLKRAMALPGFEFADTPVDVPPGGYLVVHEK
jgi:hypothetical protein